MKAPNPQHDSHDDQFDQTTRVVHALAVARLSPQARARLREARHAAALSTTPQHQFGWLLAGGAVAAAVALMLAVQLRPATPEPSPTPRMASATPTPGPAERASRRAELDGELDDMLAALDENPDLYLWLAANDDALPPPSE